ncbi:S-adenosylmethionine mitochondrial carrier protein [Copidosoma floridanum]|uniref:S-adenosylmethionine mitochondrial carrier protein n=1 Tax=Copidosoma floridanum TaxID=29053 RepID=UPI0006C9A03A|nr:S-adenosylmethionine mitochondrial carrier protein [Copidosoma floridanum]
MDVYQDEKIELAARRIFIVSLISGGLAGTLVDIALFPIDTLKTRLQSERGFLQSGGFRQLYKGLSPVILGSAPTAALFFVTYESLKMLLEHRVPKEYSPLVHMGAASFSEVASCLIRVPVEVVKQRKQALLPDHRHFSIRLLYRGYWSTVLRDMPFSLIQFPIWEYFKQVWGEYAQRAIYPYEGALCGAAAGSIAAAITTPLDVAKTRIMLSCKSVEKSSELTVWEVLSSIHRINGIRGLFSGIVPRVTWISIGGFIFFGVYEKSKALLS